MASAHSVVSKEADIWVLRLHTASGKVQEYRCSTEGQARQLALLLSASNDMREASQPAA
ncbi:MAG: hypothetical protein ABW123_20090 [Cystobacter sp.]